MPLFDATTSILEQSMNVRLDRQNLLASDLANANTPGFVAKDLDFEKEINSAGQQLENAQFARNQLGQSDGVEHVQSLDRMSLSGGSMSLSLPAPTLGTEAPQLAVGGLLSLDQNRVDTDHAMVSLAANAINYGASAKAIAKKLAILSYCANDGQG